MSSTPQTVCPACDTQRTDVEFKTDLGEGDVLVCEDCYNRIEEEDDDCVIPSCCNGVEGCSQCCSEEEEEEEDEEEEDEDESS